MEILFSEFFLLFEVPLLWVEVEVAGLLLIVLSLEEITDLSLICLTVVAVEVFSVPRTEEAFKEGALFSSWIVPFDFAVSNELLVTKDTRIGVINCAKFSMILSSYTRTKVQMGTVLVWESPPVSRQATKTNRGKFSEHCLSA